MIVVPTERAFCTGGGHEDAEKDGNGPGFVHTRRWFALKGFGCVRIELGAFGACGFYVSVGFIPTLSLGCFCSCARCVGCF